MKKLKKVLSLLGIELECGWRFGYMSVKTVKVFYFIFLLEIGIHFCKVFVDFLCTFSYTSIFYNTSPVSYEKKKKKMMEKKIEFYDVMNLQKMPI